MWIVSTIVAVVISIGFLFCKEFYKLEKQHKVEIERYLKERKRNKNEN